MHDVKVPLQPEFKRHMHGRLDFVLPQPARADVMVEREQVENVENTR